MKMRIPLIFRTIVLRLLLLSSLSGLFLTGFHASLFSLQYDPLSQSYLDSLSKIVLPILIILHHTLRLWPRKLWLVICEVLLSLVEVVITGYLFAPVLPVEIQMVKGNGNPLLNPSLEMMYAVSWFVTVVCSFITFVFLFCDILGGDRKYLLRQYNFSAGLCPPGHQWRFICGRFVTRKRFNTDNRFIRCTRAVLSFLCLFTISALAIYVLILQPIELGGRQGVKISRISAFNGDSGAAMMTEDTVGMGETQIALSKALGSPLNRLVPFQAVLAVSYDLHPYPTMTLSRTVGDIVARSGCRNSTVSNGTVLVGCDGVLLPFGRRVFGEILITIKFPPERADSNQLYLGLTNSADDILAGAEPIDIFAGSNLRGISSILVKERISNQQAATFGIPQYRRFAIMNVGSLSADPAPMLPRDDFTTTIRVLVFSQPYIEVEQEYIESSVLNGFALVGGVWTLVNGVFAAIFGSTLLLVLFGIKPLSIYGLVHFFRPGRGSLADGGYALSPEERDRTVGILREHLLDVEGAEGDGASPPHYSPVGVLPQYTCSHCGKVDAVQTHPL